MKPNAIEFTLLDVPIPPSVNRLYYTSHRLTKEHRGFREEIWEKWYKKGKPRLGGGPFTVEIVVPRKTRGDCDNRVKAVLDALAKFGATPDDRFADAPTCKRGDIALPGGGCMIIVRSLPLDERRAA